MCEECVVLLFRIFCPARSSALSDPRFSIRSRGRGEQGERFKFGIDDFCLEVEVKSACRNPHHYDGALKIRLV